MEFFYYWPSKNSSAEVGWCHMMVIHRQPLWIILAQPKFHHYGRNMQKYQAKIELLKNHGTNFIQSPTMKNSLFTDFSTSFTAAEFTFTTFAVRETIVWPKHTDTNTTTARWALSFWWENRSRVCNTKWNLLESNACMMIVITGYHRLIGWIKKPLSSSGHCYQAAYEADVYSIAT